MSYSRPNILLFMSDNQSADFIGCYGNPEVITPNIDLLAETGMKFTSAFCVNAMCSPCRASVLTGMMPSAHGIHNWLDDNLENFWPDNWNAIGEFENLPSQLKKHGYINAIIGKYHLGKAWKSPLAFDHWVTFPHGHTKSFYNNQIIDNNKNYHYEGHSVEFFTQKTVDFLKEQERSSKPFFCFVPFNGPYGHWPSIKGRSDNKFANLYDNCELTSVPREGINKRVIDRYNFRILENKGNLPEQFLGPLLLPNNKESLRNYFSQTSLIDHGIGRILNELKSLKLFENTIIIYTSDHGFSLGNHGIWGHGLAAWPSSIHRPSFNIPLIFSGPGIKRGISNTLVSQLDLSNTILNLAEIDSLNGKWVDSRSIDMSNEKDEKRTMIYMEQEETRAIRTKDWLYMERFNIDKMPKLYPELYNLKKDPDEREDLSNNKKYFSVIKDLSIRMHNYFDEHANSKYDLWKGGSAKSNVANLSFWKNVWGDQWSCTFE